MITVHQSDDEPKEQFYFERTVFLRCVASSNPPVVYTWTRDREVIAEGSDSGVEIYKPFFTQVRSQDYATHAGNRLTSQEMRSGFFFSGRTDVRFNLIFLLPVCSDHH